MSQDTPDPQDRYEQFVTLFARHEVGLRAFVRSLLPIRHAVDDVVQETSLVLWRKFDTFEPGTNFLSWACTIARFKVLGHLRSLARDRLQFDEDIVQLLVDESEARQRQLALERDALNGCLGKLDERRRQLITRCYLQPGTIRDVAEELGRSPATLYKVLYRTRRTLLDCIRGRLAEGG